MILLQILAFVLGLYLVATTLFSAVTTFVLPRSTPDQLTRVVFVVMRRLLEFFIRRAKTYGHKDRILALYAPFSLMAMLPSWLLLVTLGYTAMFWAVGGRSVSTAFWMSGSAILTLGFAPADTLSERLLAFTEATIGLMLVALLIAYLPTMYNAFSRRETAVTLLDVRAGNPPSAVEMLARLHRIGHFEHLDQIWEYWETWFAELEESHTSLAALVFFRSPVPEYSWVTAAGAILDSAALLLAAVEVSQTNMRASELPRHPQAALCIRAGYLALRRIGDFFNVPYDSDPRPTDPISITREEFDDACRRLRDSGVPLKVDLDQAWRDFQGWRVNYDTVLLALCSITMAPEAPWSSDRAPEYVVPSIRLGRYS